MEKFRIATINEAIVNLLVVVRFTEKRGALISERLNTFKHTAHSSMGVIFKHIKKTFPLNCRLNVICTHYLRL